MTPERLDQLVWGELDGELTGEERAELARELAESADSRTWAEEIRALAGVLQAVPAVPVPPALEAVLRAGLDRRSAQSQRTGNAVGNSAKVIPFRRLSWFQQRREAMGNTKKFTIAAFVAFAIVAVLGLFYPRPDGSTIIGTMGGVEKADRYRAPQIHKGDVALEDAEMHNLLQSDEIKNLLEDEAFRKALASPAVQAALANPAVASALANPAVASALANPALASALANPAFASALANPAVASALANPAFASALANP
ncbi:MAG TPA: hypothetical protein VI942_02120, partial [Thermoanaerobaculia bacterium]|nr:hypothetical protein [Thermoanaerobaculia bacterium]